MGSGITHLKCGHKHPKNEIFPPSSTLYLTKKGNKLKNPRLAEPLSHTKFP